MRAAIASLCLAFSLGAYGADVKIGSVPTVTTEAGAYLLGSVGTGVSAPARLLSADLVQDGTVNTGVVKPFQNKLLDGSAQKRILILGDSYTDHPSTISWQLVQRLFDRHGYGGTGLRGNGNHIYSVVAGGAVKTNATSGLADNGTNAWMSTYFKIPTGGSVTWQYGLTSNAGEPCDHVELYWVAGPDGGSMNLQINTAGGSYSTIATLDGYSAEKVGRSTNLTVSLASHAVKVVGVSGTENLVIGPAIYTAGGGVVTYHAGLGGLPATNFLATATAIKSNIVAGINPDLILWHNLDNDPTQDVLLTNVLMTDWLKGYPVVALGYFPLPSDGETGNSYSGPSTMALRRAALQNGWAYVDLYPESRGHSYLTNNGWMNPDAGQVHLLIEGAEILASEVWRKLGLEVVKTNVVSASTDNVTNYFFFSAARGMSERGVVLNTDTPTTPVQHLYSVTGNQAALYRTYGVLMPSNSTYNAVTFPVSSAVFGEGRTNIYARQVCLFREPTTTSISIRLYNLALGTQDVQDYASTFSAVNQQGWTRSGSTTNFEASAWVPVKPGNLGPWAGHILCSQSSVAATHDYWMYGLEVRVDPN